MEISTQKAKIDLFGISIDNFSFIEAIKEIENLYQEKIPNYVVTPNVDHIVRLQKDQLFRCAYQEASLVLPDGMPLIWASKLLRKPLKERVTGSDLFPKLCGKAAEKGFKMFLLGGLKGIAEKAFSNLKKLYPSLNVVGIYSPPWGFENDDQENQKIISLINQVEPDLLFIGFGTPKQENWIYKYRKQLKIKTALCVGAAFDFEAGSVKRAPFWIRQMGFEWGWRLLNEPRRLAKRYLIDDMTFIWLLIKEIYKSRR